MAELLSNKSIRWPWAQLIRVPNLFTVPGDAVVGFVLAWPVHTGGMPDLLAALLSGLFLYAAGMVMNDLVDIERDKAERPNRPLASGAITPFAARNFTALLIALALGLLALRSLELLVAGIVLTGLIFIYNFLARRSRLAGSAVMGLCRSGSMALGVVAASPGGFVVYAVLVAMAFWFIYITGISWLAYREMQLGAYNRMRWFPMVTIAGGALAIIVITGQSEIQSIQRSIFGFAFALVLAFQAGIQLGIPLKTLVTNGRVRIRNGAGIYPPAIGLLISALLPMQAAVIILNADQGWMFLAALLLLFAWPINRLLAKHIAPS
jgi:UbiA prenyltransferase family